MTDPAVRSDDSLLTDDDLFLFHEGSHFNLWEKLGSHPRIVGGVAGTSFGVWAPNAERVSIVGDFNRWLPGEHPLRRRGGSGVWEGFVPEIGVGNAYKYHVESKYNLHRADKTDPFGFASEVAPHNASIVADLTYAWGDAAWLAERKERHAPDAPISIYGLHLGSWRHVVEENDRPLTYREIAKPLADYVIDLGFTHVEFLPLLEHPFYGSWGYQAPGFFRSEEH